MTKPTTDKETTINNAEIVLIPFNKLECSKNNVRTVDTNDMDDMALVQSIRDSGLLQNLVVKQNRAKFGVSAGGRRYNALKYLVENKELPKDYHVPCKVKNDDETLTSLAENNFRKKNHPADNFMAIKKLKDEGKSIDAISLSLSMPAKEIKKLLALADVHPKIVDAFKRDKIDFDMVVAYTTTQDQKKQYAFFKSGGATVPWQVREHFKESVVDSKDAIALYVGEKAYVKAGGKVSNDLLHDNVYFLDADLITRMAEEKLQKNIPRLKEEGWAWVEATKDTMYTHNYESYLAKDYVGIPKKLLQSLDDAEEAVGNNNEAWDDAINEAGMENDWKISEKEEKAFKAKEKKLDSTLKSIKGKADKYKSYSDAQKNVSGTVICLDNNGKLKTLRAVQNKDDVKKEINIQKQADSDNPDQAQVEVTGDISMALKETLDNYDLQLFQLDMVRNPKIAFKGFAFEHCYRLLSNKKGSWSACFAGFIKENINRDEPMIQSQSYKELDKIRCGIDTSWIRETISESFEAFCKLSDAKIIDLTGLCSGIASTANASYYGRADHTIYRSLQTQTGIVKSEHWRPTAQNYFKRLSLPLLHKLAIDLLGDEWLKPHLKLSKKDFVKIVDDAFNGDTIKDKATKAKLDAYMPEVMV